MRTGQRHRRSIALVTAGGLAALIATVPAGPVQASPVVGAVQALSGTSPGTAGALCTKTGTTPPPVSAPYANGSAIASTSVNARYTANADSTDTVDIAGSLVAASTVALDHGALRHFALRGTSTMQVVESKGAASVCDSVSAQMQGATSFAFAVPKKGWLYVTRNQPKSFATEAIVVASSGVSPLYDIFGGPRSNSTLRVFLPADTYTMVAAVVQSTPNTAFTKSFLSSSVTGVFRLAGSALGAARGSATPYVGFPGSVSCAHHSATLTWSGKAGQVKNAVFSVNGAEKAAVTKPQTGDHVVLKKLAGAADAHVTASLLMKSGARTTATRTYLACTK
jgi:hypothetical protein